MGVFMKSERIWTAALMVIGDEILSGRTQDKNIAQLAMWLNVQGIRLAEVRVVADVQERIVEAVNALRARNDYLFTTGGIGPTHDDITVDAVAAALDVPVVVHPHAREVLEEYYKNRGGLTDARLRMARVPEGADLVVLVAGPGGHAHAAAGIGQACGHFRVMTTGFIVGAASASEDALSKTLAQVRPWSLMVVIADGDEYIDDMLTALRA